MAVIKRKHCRTQNILKSENKRTNDIASQFER